jgi:transposase InsO family protein
MELSCGCSVSLARRVAGWALSYRPDAELVVKALDHAYEQRGKPTGVLFHSDQVSELGVGAKIARDLGLSPGNIEPLQSSQR